MNKLLLFKLLVLAVVAPSGATAQSLSITYYSQRDSRWAGDKMGSSSLTLHDWGCMTTCVSNMYRRTPKDVNNWLGANGGYTSGGALVHSRAAGFDGSGGVQYSGSSTLPGNAAAVGRAIERGAAYITQSSRFGTSRTHWVLVYRIHDGRAVYHDPYDGKSYYVGGWVRYGNAARVYATR